MPPPALAPAFKYTPPATTPISRRARTTTALIGKDAPPIRWATAIAANFQLLLITSPRRIEFD